ncbi:hypothetical protein KCP71_23725 [Salmonella enterica subsp. enterica]|nr:hypothetical protein KCP71_23725 [Salmonella enterica subsp. enterica]
MKDPRASENARLDDTSSEFNTQRVECLELITDGNRSRHCRISQLPTESRGA